MAPNLKTFMSTIPKGVWKIVKKLLGDGERNVYDKCLKLSTNLSSALLIILLCVSLNDKFLPGTGFECTRGQDWEALEKKGKATPSKSTYNNRCWTEGTFVVKKGFLPEYERDAIAPGIIPYIKGHDETIIIDFFKYAWIAFTVGAVLDLLPLRIWKPTAYSKLDSILKRDEEAERMRRKIERNDASRLHRRSTNRSTLNKLEPECKVDHFICLVGRNRAFGVAFIFTKLLVVLTKVCQWYFVQVMVSQDFKWYGVDVIFDKINKSNKWPQRMDVIFPKITKCEYGGYGPGGDQETSNGLCYIMLNHILQWLFLAWWFSLVITFAASTASLVLYLIPLLKSVRTKYYFSLLAHFENLEYIRAMSNECVRIEMHRVDVILGYGDWLLLHFLSKNMNEIDYVRFLEYLLCRNALVRNQGIELVEMGMSNPKLNESDAAKIAPKKNVVKRSWYSGWFKPNV